MFELDYRPYTWQSAEETAVYYTLVAEQSDIVIGTRDEFDVMENRSGGGNDETVRHLFAHSADLVVIKHGVDGSYAYSRSGEVFRAHAYKTKVLKTSERVIPMRQPSSTDLSAAGILKRL